MIDMFCPSCQANRPVDAMPCARCGAPSPLAAGVMGAVPPSTAWGDPTVVAPNSQWMRPDVWGGPTVAGPGNQWGSQPEIPPASFVPTPVNDNSLWAQVMGQQGMQAPVSAQEPGNGASTPPNVYNQPGMSLLPVPYQESMGALTQLPGNMLAPIPQTDTNVGALIPVLPQEAEPIHILPMYTKPRAIIPRYRAISGLLSVLIVFLLLCSGATYYAKATGKLSFVHQIIGDARPKDMKPTPVPQRVPKTQPDYGPAADIINSATTTDSIEPQTDFALNQTYVFHPNQLIYVTYSVHPKAKGVVTFKWYTDGNIYRVSSSLPIQDAKNGYTEMQFSEPVDGKVELYWNNQLAITLYFVVQ